MKCTFFAVAALAAMLLPGTPAIASCADGKMSYDDIVAVRYARTACFGTCPSYEVLFSPGDNYYVGRAYVARKGTYRSSNGAIFNSVIQILKQQAFYSLSGGSENEVVTDVPHYLIAVERCHVTTKIDWNSTGDRPRLQRIFDGLDALERRLTWKKSSESDESPEDLLAPIP